MRADDERRGGYGVGESAGDTGRRRKRLSVGRVLLNIAVVGAFSVAVYTMYSLVQDSGILEARTVDGTVTSTTAVTLFSDVSNDDPHSATLEEAVVLGLVEPSSATRFGVGEPVTRGELAVTVAKAAGLQVRVDEVHSFPDVVGDGAVLDRSDYVAVVAALDIMGGTGEEGGVFEPDRPVSMGQALVAFARAAGGSLPEAAPDGSETTTSEGAAAPTEAELAFMRLTAAGILDGISIAADADSLSAEADRARVAVIAVKLRSFLAAA